MLDACPTSYSVYHLEPGFVQIAVSSLASEYIYIYIYLCALYKYIQQIHPLHTALGRHQTPTVHAPFLRITAATAPIPAAIITRNSSCDIANISIARNNGIVTANGGLVVGIQSTGNLNSVQRDHVPPLYCPKTALKTATAPIPAAKSCDIANIRISDMGRYNGPYRIGSWCHDF